MKRRMRWQRRGVQALHRPIKGKIAETIAKWSVDEDLRWGKTP